MEPINHHYIPRLYLKGFVSDSGKLRVFDKKYGKFKKDKETPNTVFFEKYRNTIKINGVSTNTIEEFYSKLETSFGVFFNLVREGLSNDEILSKHGLEIIKQYLAIQFWRLPMLDNYSDQFIKDLDLKKYGNRITINENNIGDVKELSHLIQEDADFRYYFRCFYLPILTFDIKVKDDEDKYWSIHDVDPNKKGWDNILCSDNPIVIDKHLDIFRFECKFIFPLSKIKILIFNKDQKEPRNLDPSFSTRLAMVLYAQSTRYIAGANMEYISKVISLYQQFYGPTKLDQLRNELFSELTKSINFNSFEKE